MPEFDLDAAVSLLNSKKDEAIALAKALKALATPKDAAPTETVQQLKQLIKDIDDGFDALGEAAAAQHKEQVQQLNELVDAMEDALTDPTLGTGVRNAIQSRLNVRRAELLQLQAQLATDYGDLLTAADVVRIEKDLASAKKDVTKKKQIAQCIAAALQIADIALFIAGKLLKAAII